MARPRLYKEPDRLTISLPKHVKTIAVKLAQRERISVSALVGRLIEAAKETK